MSDAPLAVALSVTIHFVSVVRQIRYMSSENTARKLRVAEHVRRYAP